MQNTELLQSLVDDLSRIKAIHASLKHQLRDAEKTLRRLSDTPDTFSDFDLAERVMKLITATPGISKAQIGHTLQRSGNAAALAAVLRYLVESGMVVEEMQRGDKGRPSATYRPATPA